MLSKVQALQTQEGMGHAEKSRDGIERRLARHMTLASASCPSIKAKRVTMHTLRHTAAIRLLLAGNDITVIALWLGQTRTTRHDQRLPARRHDPTSSKRSTAPNRSLPSPAATDRPMPSSPSLRRCDYADNFRNPTPLTSTVAGRSA